MAELSDWVFESILQYLKCPLWNTPINNFLDENCHIFDSEDPENKLEYTSIHNEFRELVDKLLTDFLEELGVSTQAFMDACTSGCNAELSAMVNDYIYALDDFPSFRALMEKKNVEMELDAMYEYAKYSNGAVEDDEEIDDDERFLIEMAIHMSLGDEDVAMKRLEKEDKDALHELAVKVAQEQERLLRAAMEEADEERKAELAAEAEKKIEAMTSEVDARRVEKVEAAVSNSSAPSGSVAPVVLNNISERRNVAFGAKSALPSIPAGEKPAIAPVSAHPTFEQIKKEVKEQKAQADSNEPSQEELERRAAYFKAHRQKLREERKAERQEELEQYKKANNITSKPAESSAPAQEKENSEREMRKEIAMRFKEDLIQETRKAAGQA